MKIKMSKDVIMYLLIAAVRDFEEKVKKEYVKNHREYAQVLRVFPDNELLQFFLNYDAPCRTDLLFFIFLIGDNMLSPEIAEEYIDLRHDFKLEIEELRNDYLRKMER